MSGVAARRAEPDPTEGFWREPPPITAALAPDRLAPSARSLLVVDDLAMNRDVLGAFLDGSGYAVQLAESGEAAVKLASEYDFDLILMDIRMPDMDGLEASRRIRSLPGRHGTVPMVALSAYAFADQVLQCRIAGLDGHVTKPVDYTTLIRTVADAIARVPSPWPSDFPAPVPDRPSPNDAAEPPPARLDHAVLNATLGFLPAGKARAALDSLQVRMEQMVRLLDQPADVAMLRDAAHALGSVAGMFGFGALSKAARSFERATMADPVDIGDLGQALRAETCAALAALDARLRDTRLKPSETVPQRGNGVIVVENDPLVRSVIRAMLKYAKQEVFLAADGLEAVVLARQVKACLVLLDISMPRLNGLLACEAIRGMPDYADVPIVMLSGHGDERMLRAARRLGATDFITKPFRANEVMARLAMHIDTPVRPLRGVFPEVPEPAALEASDTYDDEGDMLRGGWVRLETVRPEASSGPLKGLRQSIEGIFLYAGVPANLVRKWLGFAQASPTIVSSGGVRVDAAVGAPGNPGFLN